MSTGLSLAGGLLLIAISAMITAGLIIALMPWLQRYAMARPSARSSHTVPTPQGAGVAIVLMPIIVLAIFGVQSHTGSETGGWALQLGLALIALAAVGALDDVYSLPVLVRLIVQFAAAAMVATSIPDDVLVFALVPGWLETAVLIIGLVWFINLTNFMDGIDGITVIEMLSISTGVILIHAVTATPGLGVVSTVAVGLIGALLGFAPFNRHVASVFMGDVGSLPIGALAGWMLIVIAAEGYLAAALLLPLYYLADATATLYRRRLRGEKLHEAHREHFYQLAVQRGFRVPEVTNRIFGLNTVLVLLALLSVEIASPVVDVACLIAGGILTAALLRHFERGRDG